MRLTVHVTNAKRVKTQKMTPEGPKTITRTYNTLSFEVDSEDDLHEVKTYIEENELGKYHDHYFSNSRVPGRSRGKKK